MKKQTPSKLDNHSLSEKEAGQEKPSSNDAEHQRVAVEAQLRKGPTTTLYFREVLGIMSIAARVFELRHGEKALNIQLNWQYASDASGTLHKQGLYTLQPGKWETNKYKSPSRLKEGCSDG